MNTKLIIASLVVCYSSVVMADPSVTFSADARGESDGAAGCDSQFDDQRFGYGDLDERSIDERFDQSEVPRAAISSAYRREGWHGAGWEGEGMLPPVYRPVTLAVGASFANQGRKFITVGSRAGQFGTIQIRAAGGRTFIKQVYVQFEDGQEQVIRDLDRTLTGHQGITLDLDGGRRSIRRIVVYGSDVNGSWSNASDGRYLGDPYGAYSRPRSYSRRQRGGSFTVTAA